MRDAILETTAALVAQHGLRSVTMSQIAEATGIGRATLYKYFSGVGADPDCLARTPRRCAPGASHALRNQSGEPGPRLEAVLHAYALISFERHRHGPEVRAVVHQGEHIAGPEQQLVDIVQGLVAEGSEAGVIRSDLPPEELTTFCLHALEAAGSMPAKSAVNRLVGVVMDALKPESVGAQHARSTHRSRAEYNT